MFREVDRKREELRVMVGERYRDLIEAADTIHKMRECSSSVIQSVRVMGDSCRDLQHGQGLARLQDANTAPVQSQVQVVTPTSAHLAVAASIKLLTALPEQIWAAVEAENWSGAAELYLLAQRVHTGLQVDQGAGVTHDKIRAWFPVISRQWDVITQLLSSLVAGARAQLSVEQLSVTRAVDCMAALMLLCQYSVSQALHTLLQCRTDSLRAVVASCRSESAVVGVSGVSRCVQSTISSLLGAVERLGPALEAITRSDSATVARIPGSVLGPTARHLPVPVTSYRPHVAGAVAQDLEDADADMLVQGWMLTCVDLTKAELKAMLKFVESVDGLKRVRETVSEIAGDQKVEQLDNQTIWEIIFKEIIEERIMEIVTLQLENMMTTVYKEVDAMIAENIDVLDFVWTDCATDLGGVWGRGRAEKVGLRMKCWGWSSKMQDIWRQLDTSLERSLESITHHPEILDRSRDIAGVCVKKLIENVSNSSSNHVTRTRVLQSIIPLTPNITQLLSHQMPVIKKHLEDRQNHLLSMWLSEQLTPFTSMLSELTSSACLQCLPAWDEVSISEAGDSGQTVTSTITVPASPSLPLVTSLLELSTSIHRQHPTSLPASLLSSANTMCLAAIFQFYENLASQTLNQNFALQLLFDIQFVQTLMVSRDAKDIYDPRLKSVMSSLEANIDPFDLSVFSMHLAQRVKTSAARLLNGLAGLVPPDRAGLVSSYKGVPSDSHNILTVSTQTCSRFQLLPLAPVTNRSLKTSLTPSTLVLDTHSKSPRLDSKYVQQTAANFFGSMSWFGSN